MYYINYRQFINLILYDFCVAITLIFFIYLHMHTDRERESLHSYYSQNVQNYHTIKSHVIYTALYTLKNYGHTRTHLHFNSLFPSFSFNFLLNSHLSFFFFCFPLFLPKNSHYHYITEVIFTSSNLNGKMAAAQSFPVSPESSSGENKLSPNTNSAIDLSRILHHCCYSD